MLKVSNTDEMSLQQYRHTHTRNESTIFYRAPCRWCGQKITVHDSWHACAQGSEHYRCEQLHAEGYGRKAN